MPSTLDSVRATAFDFDGVIVDSMPVHWNCWREALNAVLGSQAGRYQEAIRRNLFTGRAGAEMFEGTGIPAGARGPLRARKDALWLEHAASVPLLPFAAEALTTLAARFPLAIATTARRNFVDAVLSRERLSHLFGLIVTNADVTRPKPAPEILERIVRNLGIPACEIAMVGDTAHDYRMAEAAGSPFLWFGSDTLARPAGNVHPVVANWYALVAVFG